MNRNIKIHRIRWSDYRPGKRYRATVTWSRLDSRYRVRRHDDAHGENPAQAVGTAISIAESKAKLPLGKDPHENILSAEKILIRYPNLIRALQWVAIFCDYEAASAIRDHQFNRFHHTDIPGCEAVSQWCGKKPISVLLDHAFKIRHSTPPYTERRERRQHTVGTILESTVAEDLRLQGLDWVDDYYLPSLADLLNLDQVPTGAYIGTPNGGPAQLWITYDPIPYGLGSKFDRVALLEYPVTTARPGAQVPGHPFFVRYLNLWRNLS